MQITFETVKLLGFNATGDLGPFTAYTSTRHGTVWFYKSPPLKPPSRFQIRQRDRFRLAAEGWRSLTDEERSRWDLACRLAGLYLSGYNLWIFWQLVQSRPHMRTIERQSGVTLLPDQ